MSNAGKNMRTHSFDTSFAALVDSKLHCAATTPNAMVSRTENEAWIAPAKGTRSSDASTPMVPEVMDR